MVYKIYTCNLMDYYSNYIKSDIQFDNNFKKEEINKSVMDYDSCHLQGKIRT